MSQILIPGLLRGGVFTVTGGGSIITPNFGVMTAAGITPPPPVNAALPRGISLSLRQEEEWFPTFRRNFAVVGAVAIDIRPYTQIFVC